MVPLEGDSVGLVEEGILVAKSGVGGRLSGAKLLGSSEITSEREGAGVPISRKLLMHVPSSVISAQLLSMTDVQL
jgi:hypothetical protein